jgi:hypothetical protein
MDLREKESVEERMRSLDDHALLRLVAIEAGDYRPEALTIARAELQRRRLDAAPPGQYLERFPQEKIGPDAFCQQCRSVTTDESPGDTTVVNLVFGTRLIGHDDVCAVCGSVLQTKWFCIGIPIIPLGRYRVVWLKPREMALGEAFWESVKQGLGSTYPYNGRRLRTSEDQEVANLARDLRSMLAEKLPAFCRFLTDANPMLHAPWPDTRAEFALSVIFLGDRFQILFFAPQTTLRAERKVLTRGGIPAAISAVVEVLGHIEARRLVVDLHRNGLLSFRPKTTAVFREASTAPDPRTYRTLSWTRDSTAA